MKKRNRKLRKALLLTCCALALVAISVGATLAYLTDTEGVTNVFTVGQVGISLDEAKTNSDGEKVLENGKEIRINNTNSGNDGYTNQYHLIPGESYTKDPTVHVDADSESSWIFVKVENGIADIEATGNTTIASQIIANDWTKLNGLENVYYQAYTKNQPDKDLEVFSSFTLKGKDLVNGTKPNDYTGNDKFIGDYANATVKITAYAIQMAGFDSALNKDEQNALAAWTAGDWNN